MFILRIASLMLVLTLLIPTTGYTALVPDTACTAEAERSLREAEVNLNELDDQLYEGKPRNIYRVYNTDGELCFASPRRITEGDFVTIGVYGVSTELNALTTNIVSCSPPSPDGRFLDTITSLPKFGSGQQPARGSSTNSIRWLSTVQCYDEEIQVQLIDAQNSARFDKGLSQFPRYRGTYQLGVVVTKPQPSTFITATINGVEQIRQKESNDDGPLYVGSLLLYALPRHLSHIGREGSYVGRDIINENDWRDRLGLMLSFGLTDPEDLLGVGFSFEIVGGINLTYQYLYHRQDELDGLDIGDPFTSSSGMIPTRRVWESDWVLGLSIDGRYLSRFFTN